MYAYFIAVSYHRALNIKIIVIWRYNPLWVFAFSAKSLQVLLPLAVSFQFSTFILFRSSITSSCHCCLGLPTGQIPIDFQFSSFLAGLAWSILWLCPSHLILCALLNLTISAPTINLSISMPFRILHILSILTGPNISLSICLSKMRRLFPSFAVNVLSLWWTRNDWSYHRFIFFSFWCFSLGISILLALHWHSVLCYPLPLLRQFLYSVCY